MRVRVRAETKRDMIAYYCFPSLLSLETSRKRERFLSTLKNPTTLPLDYQIHFGRNLT